MICRDSEIWLDVGAKLVNTSKCIITLHFLYSVFLVLVVLKFSKVLNYVLAFFLLHECMHIEEGEPFYVRYQFSAFLLPIIMLKGSWINNPFFWRISFLGVHLWRILYFNCRKICRPLFCIKIFFNKRLR